MEVVQPGICVVDVAPVAQRVIGSQGGSHGAGSAAQLAPGVISVVDHRTAAAIDDGNHITLRIKNIIVCRAIVLNADGPPGGIVCEVHLSGAVGHGHQLGTVIGVLPGGGAVAAAGAHSVRAIRKVPGHPVSGHVFQPAATLPGVAPGAVTKGVANRIISNGFAAVGSQQVAPAAGTEFYLSTGRGAFYFLSLLR